MEANQGNNTFFLRTNTEFLRNRDLLKTNKFMKLIGESEFFHTERGEGYLKLMVDGRSELWPVMGKELKDWLQWGYLKEYGESPKPGKLNETLRAMEGKAKFQGKKIKVDLRVAESQGSFFYDLSNAEGQVVEIAPKGWDVVKDPQVYFRRYLNTAPQVLPKEGGDLEQLLSKYINLSGADLLQLLVYIVTAFIPNIAHPIPILYGDKGSAKSTLMRIIKTLIDPAYQTLLTLPNNKNELALTLSTNYAPCFDNLSNLQVWQSDMLCSAVTGGGLSKRKLFTDSGEVLMDVQGSPMLNGIGLVATRDDLLDRSLLFELHRLSPKERKAESDFWKDFEVDRSVILGGIFDTLSEAIRIYPEVQLTELPRMADFTKWGYAVAKAVGGKGEEFLKSYNNNIKLATLDAVEADPVGAALVELVNSQPEKSWEGTPTEFLNALNSLPGSHGLPKAAHALTRRINEIKSALNDLGMEIEFSRSENRNYKIYYRQ